MKSKTLVCCRFYPACYCLDENSRLRKIILAIVTVVGVVSVVALLMGCNPLESVPDRPNPSPSVMYTVIHPEE